MTKASFVAALREIVGLAGLEEMLGRVFAWRASHERLPRVLAENALLRQQLQSVALQSMSTVDLMKMPLTDSAPQLPNRNAN